jgi:hypothetical protein
MISLQMILSLIPVGFFPQSIFEILRVNSSEFPVVDGSDLISIWVNENVVLTKVIVIDHEICIV